MTIQQTCQSSRYLPIEMPDLVQHIFKFLDPDTLSIAARVCRLWHSSANEELDNRDHYLQQLLERVICLPSTRLTRTELVNLYWTRRNQLLNYPSLVEKTVDLFAFTTYLRYGGEHPLLQFMALAIHQNIKKTDSPFAQSNETGLIRYSKEVLWKQKINSLFNIFKFASGENRNLFEIRDRSLQAQFPIIWALDIYFDAVNLMVHRSSKYSIPRDHPECIQKVFEMTERLKVPCQSISPTLYNKLTTFWARCLLGGDEAELPQPPYAQEFLNSLKQQLIKFANAAPAYSNNAGSFIYQILSAMQKFGASHILADLQVILTNEENEVRLKACLKSITEGL